MRNALLCLFLTVVAIAGCASDKRHKDPNVAIKSQDPKHRVEAALELAKKGDRTAIPTLIQSLRDDDVSVRYFSCLALVRLTGGQRFGYHAYGSENQRETAVREWERWWASQASAGGAEPPATNDSAKPR